MGRKIIEEIKKGERWRKNEIGFYNIKELSRKIYNIRNVYENQLKVYIENQG